MNGTLDTSPLCELTVHNGSNIYLSHHQKCLEFDLKYKGIGTLKK